MFRRRRPGPMSSPARGPKPVLAYRYAQMYAGARTPAAREAIAQQIMRRVRDRRVTPENRRQLRFLVDLHARSRPAAMRRRR